MHKTCFGDARCVAPFCAREREREGASSNCLERDVDASLPLLLRPVPWGNGDHLLSLTEKTRYSGQDRSSENKTRSKTLTPLQQPSHSLALVWEGLSSTTPHITITLRKPLPCHGRGAVHSLCRWRVSVPEPPRYRQTRVGFYSLAAERSSSRV